MRTCKGCRVDVDQTAKTTRRLVEAWIPCGNNATNHTYRIGKELDLYLCPTCYDKFKRGIPFEQGSLFG